MLSTVRNSRTILRSLSKPLSSLPLDENANHLQTHVNTTGKSKKPTFEPKNTRPYKDKSIPELLRSLLVYQLCQFQPLVQHGEAILSHTRRVFGDRFTDAIVKMTFFHQFCGGEDHYQVVGKMRSLQQSGIGSILDYAAEDEGPGESTHTTAYSTNATTLNVINQPAREYDYESEELCDARVETFHHCIQTVHDAGQGKQFSAIKLTGLGNPKLLKRMADYSKQIKTTIQAHDKDAKGYLTRDEFVTAHRSLYDDKKRIDALLHRFDMNNLHESIDFIDWCSISFALDLEEPEQQTTSNASMVNIIPDIVKFTNEEIDLIHALQTRAHSVAKKASDLNVSLLIDAEQSWFQPAIDVISIGLQQTFNDVNQQQTTQQPVIFNTYQCYLKDSLDRIKEDLARSTRRGYHFGAKLVRGAYMHRERTRAAEIGYPSPIHNSFQDTNDCYNEAVDFLLKQIWKNNDLNSDIMNMHLIEVMCATHNKESIEKVIDTLEMLSLSNPPPPSSPENQQDHKKKNSFLSFAQLYGMSDDLTIPLGKNGYHVYKYLPYGKVQEVIPYMLRRAQENGDVLGKSQHERQLLLIELKERFAIF